jgi:hypothetical protein
VARMRRRGSECAGGSSTLRLITSSICKRASPIA